MAETPDFLTLRHNRDNAGARRRDRREARFTIEARQDLKNATLVLDPGWAEGITINTVEPSPVGEASRNGDLTKTRSSPRLTERSRCSLDLVQQGVTQNDFSVIGAFLAVGTIGVLTVLFSYLPWRFQALRPVLEGVPAIVVEDGNVVEKNLKRHRLTQEEIAAAARSNNIPSLAQVRWAVLETNGQVSFIKKS